MAKKTTKKAAPKKSAAKATAANKARTKSEVYGIIADETGLSKKQVGSVFESMSSIISKDSCARWVSRASRRAPGCPP